MVEVPISEPNIAAKLSATSACLMRGSLPSLSSRPARCATPISVPALSKTSTSRKREHHDEEGLLEDAREVELQNSVGASDGGSETMPVNLRKPERNADRGHDQDADHGAADHLAGVERDDQHEAEQAQDRRASS